MSRFINKKIRPRVPFIHRIDFSSNTENVENNENNEKIIEEVMMTTQEKIDAANDILTSSVKKIKRDKGLIERTESSKTILTEDNKELLKD